jgi:Transmembrane protein 65
MIGFGFMDQFVLIQAGGYIDATLGVSLGLATMTAAAAGMFLRLLYAVAFILQ